MYRHLPIKRIPKSNNNKNNNDFFINNFLLFTTNFCLANKIITDELINNKNSLFSYFKYTSKIINIYLNEKEGINFKKKFLNNKINKRNIQYLTKIMKNINRNSKSKVNNAVKKIISHCFIAFIFNIVKQNKINKNNEPSNRYLIYELLNNTLYIIGLLYLNDTINDDYYELFLKYLLIFSMEMPKNPMGIQLKEKYEINNIIIFKSCINLIEIVFNKLFLIQKELTQRQEEIINNIILFIKEKMLDSLDKQNRTAYINKIFLSKNDYKNILLIDLIFIISKIKSKSMTNLFIDLLTSIYSFSFNYENIMRPILKQLEPLIVNINNKSINQLNEEINISDFSLSLIDELKNKENQILINHSCFLKKGFYFGNPESGLVCDFNSLNNEFVIFFGFRLEKNEKKEITLFEIKYNKDNSNQLKFFLKNNGNDNYEMFAEDKNAQLQSLKININAGINYIFSIHFKIGGLMHQTSIKVNYIKDNKNNKEDLKGDKKEIKIKNFRTEDFSIYFGCDINNTGQDLIINKFRGYIGDIIILNGANFKNLYDNIEIDNLLFNLKGNYSDILSLSAEIQEYNIFFNNKNNSPKFIEIKEKIKSFGENENTLFDAIRIINSNYFNIVKYEDNIDYLESKKKNFDIEKNKTFIKKKYFDCRIKSDSSEDIRAIKIYTSIFDKNFHIFDNKLTISEFIKYDGIDYLSLLIEYYYQILCHISLNKNIYEKINLEETKKIINMKIGNNLEFFYNNIIQNKLINDIDLDKISKYICQIAITIIKFIESYILNIETIKCLVNILNTLDLIYDRNDKVDTIKINLFDFFLNPNLYHKNDENLLEKINYVMKHLLKIIKKHSVNQTNLMRQLYNIETLNKILCFSWLINNHNYNENEKKEYITLLESTKNYYSSLLLEFLKSFTPRNLIININNTNSIPQKEIIQINNENNTPLKNTKNVIEENKDEMKLIYHFFEKALENKKKNIYIFSNMLSILLKTNYIAIFDESKIKIIKSIILKQLKKQDNKIKNKLTFISCLKILIAYYFTDNQKNRLKENKLKNKERNFHLFLRGININLDFFYSLILILKQIHIFFNENNIDEKKVEENNEIKNFKNEEQENNNNKIDKEKENNNTSIKPLCLFDIDLKNLNEIQVHIIKSIFEDIVYLLYKFELKKVEKNKRKTIIASNECSDQNTAKEINITLKKYIDYIYTFKETTIYQEIFSSDTQICAELFYLNWKFHFNNFEDNYFEKVIMEYHQSLLKNHANPFIFKFLLFISNKNIFLLENNKDNKDNEHEQRANKSKLKLLKFIVNTLTNFQKEIKLNDEGFIFLINNILNSLIILNEELSNSSTIFQNNSFYDIFYKFSCLLDKSYLLYSNFYIEFDDNYGKIVSEIIYDIFFAISEYTFNEKEFVKIFTKDNKKEREIYTTFYLIDIFKEKILDKEKNVNEELKKFIPNIDNLRYIHKNFFNKNNHKLKIFLDKKLCQINDINFSIFFLAKSFIYLNKKVAIKDTFKEFLLGKYLPLLSKNIYRLYTKRSSFYGNKICKRFLLYSLTKKFIETYIIQNPNKFNIYDEFFASDLPVELKEEYNISYCFSSRLLHDSKRRAILNRNEINTIEKEKLNKSEILINRNLNNDFETNSNLSTRTNTLKTIPFFENNDFEKEVNNLNYFISNMDDIESNKSLGNNSISDLEENEYFSNFQLINKINSIYRPRNYFFKIIFAERFTNLIFNDNTFKLVKLQYLSRYRNYNISKSTKQINFPVKQKNFSNSVEPKIFLRKNFNFYDKKFLKISHNYLKFDVLNKNLQNFVVYPHNYKIKTPKEDLKYLFCELVTNQYIYFGKLYFKDNYIFFESEKDDPRDSNNMDIFIQYSISNITKYNKTIKKKSILIYTEDINEIIQKRTFFLDRALEIFHKNGKSFLFNYFREENIQKAYDYFNEINNNLLNYNLPQFTFKTNNNEDDIKRLVYLFHKGKISNYEYILYLNKYSTRTYNDSNQYPVFPWLLRKYDNISEIFKLLSNKETSEDISSYFRDMNYPISMQSEKSRNTAKNNFSGSDNNEYNFNFHLNTHYSTSSYIYYYLMRINPYDQNMILLQENHFDNPARLFNCIIDTKSILLRDNNNDNREIIPEIFTSFDYFCNLNCCFFGKKNKENIVDDLIISYNESPTISSYVNCIFNNKNLLNHNYVSKILSQWVDIIFGKKQLPEKKEELYESCNIYNVYCYGQIINVEKTINDLYEEFKNRPDKRKFFNEVKYNKDVISNLGINPKQILNENITYDGRNKTIEQIYKIKKANESKYIYFKKINDNFLLFKKDKSKIRMGFIYDKYLKNKEKQSYDFKSNYLIRNKLLSNKQLFNISYAFSYLSFQFEKTNFFIFLSCRYLHNFFRIQYNDKILNIVYDDFVSCIKGSSIIQKENIFYTGLFNGKLTEWEIIPYIDNTKKSKKYKINYNFQIKELKHVYAHRSSITAIEIFPNQNIIITAGEDKFIYIRKNYDFELLTVINLTYSFGNPIVSQTYNIFPSLIKISELNLLYVLLYDYDSKKYFIRGYNFNGLFFAQTDLKMDFEFNNISFTKYSNLVVGFDNYNEIQVLSASNLNSLWRKQINSEENKIQKNGTKIVEYNYNTEEFYILYDNEFYVMTLKDKDEQKEFDFL